MSLFLCVNLVPKHSQFPGNRLFTHFTCCSVEDVISTTASCMVRCYSVPLLMRLYIYCTYMFINVKQLVDNSKVHLNGIEDPCQSASDVHWPLGVYFCFRTTRKS